MALGEFEKCATCGDYCWTGTHRCKPLWLCRMADYDLKDSEEIRGSDAEEAAERYAEERDGRSGDGPRQRSVIVHDPVTNNETRFDVEFEYHVSYSAYEVNQQPTTPKGGG